MLVVREHCTIRFHRHVTDFECNTERNKLFEVPAATPHKQASP